MTLVWAYHRQTPTTWTLPKCSKVHQPEKRLKGSSFFLMIESFQTCPESLGCLWQMSNPCEKTEYTPLELALFNQATLIFTLWLSYCKLIRPINGDGIVSIQRSFSCGPNQYVYNEDPKTLLLVIEGSYFKEISHKIYRNYLDWEPKIMVFEERESEVLPPIFFHSLHPPPLPSHHSHVHTILDNVFLQSPVKVFTLNLC